MGDDEGKMRHNVPAITESAHTALADRYLELWGLRGPSPDLQRFLADNPARSVAELAVVVLVDQARRWELGRAPSAEEYLRAFPAVFDDRDLRIDVVYGEYRARCPDGDPQVAAEIVDRFPALRSELESQFEFHALMYEHERSGLQAGNWPTAIASLPTGTPTDKPARQSEGPSEAAAPLPFRDYRLEERLGAGAMGQVYRARQVSLNRAVALKFLGHAGQPSPHLIDRFLGEARAIASLRHPNIVQVHGVGRTEAQGYFIAMDLVEGVDLESRLADGPLPISEVVRIVIEVARALDHAHARGVVHRDLKPSNVMLDANGRVVVMDFGLAKRLEGPDAGLSALGDIIGTPQYMAPEQADSRWGEVGLRSDIYGLGGLLYALLTGKPPVQGATRIEVLCRVASRDEPPSVRKLRPEVPVSLEAVCAKCLHKQPLKRYVSAREVEDALRAVADATIPATSPNSAPFTASSTTGDRRLRFGFLGGFAGNLSRQFVIGAAAAAILITCLFLWQLGPPWSSVKPDDAPELAQGHPSVSPPEMPALSVDWTVDVFRGKRRENRQRITETPAAVYSGDSVRVELKFSRTIYPYVYWIGADGSMSSLYPTGANASLPGTVIAIPLSPDEGLPVLGQTGTEVCLVVCRDRPLSDLSEVVAILPRDRFPALREGAPLFRGVREGPNPGGDRIAQSTAPADDQAWRRLLDDSRHLGPAELLIDDEGRRAIVQWLATIPRDMGYIECLAVTHSVSPPAGRKSSKDDEQPDVMDASFKNGKEFSP